MKGFYSNNPTMIREDTMEKAIVRAGHVRKTQGVRAFGMLEEEEGGWVLFYWDRPMTDVQWEAHLDGLQTPAST